MNKPPGGWPLATQVAIAVLVTICLSIWQLGRGLEKLDFKTAYENKLLQPSVMESTWLAVEDDYAKVRLRGRYDPTRFFLIENRIQYGRSGYWVFGVFNTERDRYLVNRGWVSVQPTVQLDPDIHIPEEVVSIVGIAWPNPVIRTSGTPDRPTWPIRLRDVDIGQMARLTGARAYEMRLDAASDTVLDAAPLRTEFATAMHWGYAAQWLLIGGLVVGGYWFFVIRKDREDHSA